MIVSIFNSPSAHDVAKMTSRAQLLSGPNTGSFATLHIDMWSTKDDFGHFDIYGAAADFERFTAISDAINSAFAVAPHSIAAE